MRLGLPLRLALALLVALAALPLADVAKADGPLGGGIGPGPCLEGPGCILDCTPDPNCLAGCPLDAAQCLQECPISGPCPPCETPNCISTAYFVSCTVYGGGDCVCGTSPGTCDLVCGAAPAGCPIDACSYGLCHHVCAADPSFCDVGCPVDGVRVCEIPDAGPRCADDQPGAACEYVPGADSCGLLGGYRCVDGDFFCPAWIPEETLPGGVSSPAGCVLGVSNDIAYDLVQPYA
jgi:hypothetical protein